MLFQNIQQRYTRLKKQYISHNLIIDQSRNTFRFKYYAEPTFWANHYPFNNYRSVTSTYLGRIETITGHPFTIWIVLVDTLPLPWEACLFGIHILF